MSTWVLLRGLTRGSGHWGPFVRLMRERFDGQACIALDLPGNGLLNDMRTPATIEAMAVWCREQLRSMDVSPPFYLLGVSMGAMVAADWAVHAPDTLAGCVLVNSSFAGVSPWYERLRPSSYATLLSLALAPRGSAQQETAVLRLTSRNAREAAAVMDEWAAMRNANPVSGANALRQLIAAARFRPPRSAPNVALLVLASQGDALVDTRCSLDLAAQWRCDCEMHPWAGHDLTLDDGPWVVARIHEWLQRNRAIPSSNGPDDYRLL